VTSELLISYFLGELLVQLPNKYISFEEYYEKLVDFHENA